MANDSPSNKFPKETPAPSEKSRLQAPYTRVISEVVAKIEDQPILFTIAVGALLVGLTVLGAGLGSSDVRFVAVIIALLAFVVLLGHYGRAFFTLLSPPNPVRQSTAPDPISQRPVAPTVLDSIRQPDEGQMRPRKSDAVGSNPLLWDMQMEDRSHQGMPNTRWLEEHARDYLKKGSLLLVGGTSWTHFQLRVAQASIRDDRAPSLWSHVAICTEQHPGGGVVAEVSLEPASGFDAIRGSNAVHQNSLRYYDDPERWPNIAILSFPMREHLLIESLRDVANDRGIIDFMALVMPWLAAVNGTSPLPQGKGIPSAVFAMTVMQRAGLEFPPGFSPEAAYPETFWQLAKWWYSFYEERTGRQESPRGKYILRQPATAVVN